MSRSIFRLSFSDFNRAENAINGILQSNRFKQKIINGEIVWKKGGGWIGGKCLKFLFSEDQIMIFAWVTPNFGEDKEYNLDGFYGFVPKKQLLGVIEQIKIAVQ